MNNIKASLLDMDLGSVKPTSVPVETVEVGVSVGDLVLSYGRAFVQEGYRKNPARMAQINLTESEVTDYCEYLLTKRIECVNGTCQDYHRLKCLYIPAYIQYTLSMIGEVIIRDKGLKLIPVSSTTSELTFTDALKISEKIGMLIDDLCIVQDAMPRSSEGNRDVMSTALIAGYVRSLEKVEHVASTYVTAFLNMKLRQETAFAALYRVQYDDLEFIASALTTQRGLF